MILEKSIPIKNISQLTFAKQRDWFVGRELVKKLLGSGGMYCFADNILELKNAEKKHYEKKILMFE